MHRLLQQTQARSASCSPRVSRSGNEALPAALLAAAQPPSFQACLPRLPDRQPRRVRASALWDTSKADVTATSQSASAVLSAWLPGPQELPGLLAEGAFNLILIGVLGTTLLLSIQAVTTYATATMARSAATASTLSLGTSSIPCTTGPALFMRAMAATSGVLISHMCTAAAVVPSAVISLFKAVFLSIAGCLLHLL